MWALAGLVAIGLGALNELLGLGLFSSGYPTVIGDDDFAGFALSAAIVIVAALGLSTLLERRETDRIRWFGVVRRVARALGVSAGPERPPALAPEGKSGRASVATCWTTRSYPAIPTAYP